MLPTKSNYFLLQYHHFNRVFICILLSIFLSGCSSDAPSEVFQVPWMVKDETEAQYLPPKRKRYDLEEDGLPAQVPPSTRIHSLPDDPAQPWSVNYGKETVINSSLGDESQHISISNQELINTRQ